MGRTSATTVPLSPASPVRVGNPLRACAAAGDCAWFGLEHPAVEWNVALGDEHNGALRRQREFSARRWGGRQGQGRTQGGARVDGFRVVCALLAARATASNLRDELPEVLLLADGPGREALGDLAIEHEDKPQLHAIGGAGRRGHHHGDHRRRCRARAPDAQRRFYTPCSSVARASSRANSAT